MARKPTYRYVPLKGCFVSIADGREVNPRNVRRAFDAVMDKALASARRAAVQLDNETIPPDQFAERMARLVRATHVVGAKLGAGTKRRARSAATRGRVEERLAFQMEKLTLFVDEAADGDIARGSLIRRAQMYVTSGTQTFEDERRRVVQGRGEMQYERRHINSSIPCGDCIGYSALGWQPIGTLPLPGQYCECMSACRCSFEYAEEIPAAQFAFDPNQPRDRRGKWSKTAGSAAPAKPNLDSYAWAPIPREERFPPEESIVYADIDPKRHLVARFHGGFAAPHYDPNQPRDRDGKWTDTGRGAPALAPASPEKLRRKRNKAAIARGREDRKHPDRARHQINAEALMLRPLEFEATRGGFVAVDRVGEGLDHYTEGTLGALPPDSNPVHRKRRFLASVLPTLRAQLNRPGSAIDWYRQAIDRTMRVMTEVFPELANDTNAKFFKLLLGPTSPQNTPLLNLDKAADIFEAYFASGDSDATRRIPMFKADGVTKWGTKGVYDAIDRFHSLVDTYGFEGAVDWLVSPQPIGTPTNPALGSIRWQKDVDPGEVGAPSRDGPKYGTEKGSRFEHRVPGALIFGPKAGRFALNILQFAKEVTIDVWAARTWNRVQGTLMGWVTLDGKDLDIFNGKTAAAQGREGVDWQVHPDPKKAAKGARRIWGVVDQPRGEGERKLMIESFTEAATILSEELSARDGVKRVIDPMDVQALLWFAEQDLWRAHGAKNDSWSFDQAAVAYARKRGIEPDTTDILARPDAGAGRANGKGRDAGDAAGGVRRGDARPDTGPDQRDGVKPKRRRKKILAKIEALYSRLVGPASDPAMYSRGVTDLPGQSRGEAHFMAKLGHNARRRLVEDALRAKVWKPTAEANAQYASSGGYVCDMFDDEVVYEEYKTGRKYRRSYAIGKDSDVTFGEASPVIETTGYIDAAFSGAPIDFSSSVETTPGVRTGKIFEVGAWPEKNFALTPEEMAQAIEEFEPVPIDLEHKRTVFDGASSGAGIGRLSEIWASDSGRTLMGRVEFTDWATKALHGVKLPVSCAWQYVKTASGDTAKKITKLSLTVDPAITDAELVAAFSAEPIERIAAVHKLFSGEHAHDINPAPKGAPTEGKPMTVATEPGAAVKPESFAAKLFSLFKSATPEELAEVGAPMGAAFAGASAAAPAKAPAAVVAESKAEADLKARIVALEAEARTEKAVNFTRSLIERNVILPAQAPALAGLYEQALKDDGDGTTVTFGKDKVGTRAQSIEAMFAEAPDHGLTKEHAETIKSGGAALLFADFGGKGGKCAPGMTKSAGMEEDEEEMDDEERMSLLGKSTLGKRAMSAKSKK